MYFRTTRFRMQHGQKILDCLIQQLDLGNYSCSQKPELSARQDRSEGSHVMVTTRRMWGWSRIWEEKLALVKTCHSGRPAVAPKLDAAFDCGATRRKEIRRCGHAATKRRRMEAAVLGSSRACSTHPPTVERYD